MIIGKKIVSLIIYSLCDHQQSKSNLLSCTIILCNMKGNSKYSIINQHFPSRNDILHPASELRYSRCTYYNFVASSILILEDKVIFSLLPTLC